MTPTDIEAIAEDARYSVCRIIGGQPLFYLFYAGTDNRQRAIDIANQLTRRARVIEVTPEFDFFDIYDNAKPYEVEQ